MNFEKIKLNKEFRVNKLSKTSFKMAKKKIFLVDSQIN